MLSIARDHVLARQCTRHHGPHPPTTFRLSKSLTKGFMSRQGVPCIESLTRFGASWAIVRLTFPSYPPAPVFKCPSLSSDGELSSGLASARSYSSHHKVRDLHLRIHFVRHASCVSQSHRANQRRRGCSEARQRERPRVDGKL